MIQNRINIHRYMRNTSKELAREGLLKYIEEYAQQAKEGDLNLDEKFIEPIFDLSLLRIIGSKGMGKKRKRKKTTDRPQLVSTFGRVIYENLNKSNNNWHSIIPFLSATELLLTSSYLIDDFFDNQQKRFNEPTSWVKYGLRQTIISASLLDCLTKELILNKLDSNLDDKLKIYFLLNKTLQKTYIGQTINEELIRSFSLKNYLKRTKYFGSIFLGDVATGSAILANANEKQIKLAEKIGNNYGIAIMIRNDLKDYMTTELIETKLIMSKALKRIPLEDFRIGRITYPLYIALNSKYKDKLQSLLGKEKLTLDQEKEIVSMIANSKGFDKTIDLIEKYKLKALEYWKELPENESKYILRDLINLMKNSREYTDFIKSKYT